MRNFFSNHANDKKSAHQNFKSILLCNNCPDKPITNQDNILRFFFI